MTPGCPAASPRQSRLRTAGSRQHGRRNVADDQPLATTPTTGLGPGHPLHLGRQHSSHVLGLRHTRKLTGCYWATAPASGSQVATNALSTAGQSLHRRLHQDRKAEQLLAPGRTSRPRFSTLASRRPTRKGVHLRRPDAGRGDSPPAPARQRLERCLCIRRRRCLPQTSGRTCSTTHARVSYRDVSDDRDPMNDGRRDELRGARHREPEAMVRRQQSARPATRPSTTTATSSTSRIAAAITTTPRPATRRLASTATKTRSTRRPVPRSSAPNGVRRGRRGPQRGQTTADLRRTCRDTVAGVVPSGGARRHASAFSAASTPLTDSHQRPGGAHQQAGALPARAEANQCLHRDQLRDSRLQRGQRRQQPAGLGPDRLPPRTASYVQGNYNATSTNVQATPDRPAAILGDAITILSNNWSDVNSLNNPNDKDGRQAVEHRVSLRDDGRQEHRVPEAGMGNRWRLGHRRRRPQFHAHARGLGGQTISYRGAMISLYTARQLIGIYKANYNVYAPGTRDVRIRHELPAAADAAARHADVPGRQYAPLPADSAAESVGALQFPSPIPTPKGNQLLGSREFGSSWELELEVGSWELEGLSERLRLPESRRS